MSNKYIAVSYRLETQREGAERMLAEEATQEHPFMFITGMGLALDAFEAQLEGKEQGEEFSFSLAPEDAYGPYFEEAVQVLPASVFEIDGKINKDYIFEGAVVPLQNAEGERFNGTITQITPKEITVDLNHPFAGQTLHFTGRVEVSREATIEEMQEAAQQLAGGGCGGCGGGCGDCSCDGGCGGGCGGCQEG